MDADKSLRTFLTVTVGLLMILFCNPTAAAIENQGTYTRFIRTSCSVATYPRLCFSSLASQANMIQTNLQLLTCAALNVTLSSTKSTSDMMSTLLHSHGLQPRDVAAMKDCVEELRDSVDELRSSISEMGLLTRSNFQVTMNDIQTWVSAAMTDESTCTDGFEATQVDGDVKVAVRGRIVTVAQLTSNALALINQLASTRT